ncbi:MAG: hypothetical protein ACWGQW_02535 [bacterium]
MVLVFHNGKLLRPDFFKLTVVAPKVPKPLNHYKAGDTFQYIDTRTNEQLVYLAATDNGELVPAEL